MQPLVHAQTRLALERLTTTPSGSYLFIGRVGSGKRQAALNLAQTLLCEADTGEDNCAHCKQVKSGNHPDVIVLDLQGSSIGIKEIQALTGQLSVRPYQAKRRAVIIDNADSMTTEAQNALLKTLEEPPSSTTILLLTHAPENLLVTVRSRVKQIQFVPLSAAELSAQLLTANFAAADIDDALNFSDGAPRLATDLLSNPEQLTEARALAGSAGDFLSATLFGRLQQAASIASDGTVPAFLTQLGRLMKGSGVGSNISALLTARELLSRNVAPRAALERLALELET